VVVSDAVSTGWLKVSNGKYSSGIVNPFAAVNDGLVDITWVHDNSINGYFALKKMIEKVQTA